MLKANITYQVPCRDDTNNQENRCKLVANGLQLAANSHSQISYGITGNKIWDGYARAW